MNGKNKGRKKEEMEIEGVIRGPTSRTGRMSEFEGKLYKKEALSRDGSLVGP